MGFHGVIRMSHALSWSLVVSNAVSLCLISHGLSGCLMMSCAVSWSPIVSNDVACLFPVHHSYRHLQTSDGSCGGERCSYCKWQQLWSGSKTTSIKELALQPGCVTGRKSDLLLCGLGARPRLVVTRSLIPSVSLPVLVCVSSWPFQLPFSHQT